MPSIADLLAPEWGNLLVQRDVSSDVIGVGMGGQALVAAERYRQRPNCGVILKRGPQAPACYQPGVWVLWSDGAATALAMGGDREAVLLASEYVLAWCEVEGYRTPPPRTDIGAPDLSSEGLVPFLEAPPGRYLVERREMPVERGRIIIPDGVNLNTRSCEAEVISSSVDGPFQPGDGVFLAGSVSKSFWVGHRRLWVVLPGQIPARLLEEPSEPLRPAEGVSVGMMDLLVNEDRDAAVDEGDPRGRR